MDKVHVGSDEEDDETVSGLGGNAHKGLAGASSSSAPTLHKLPQLDMTAIPGLPSTNQKKPAVVPLPSLAGPAALDARAKIKSRSFVAHGAHPTQNAPVQLPSLKRDGRQSHHTSKKQAHSASWPPVQLLHQHIHHHYHVFAKSAGALPTAMA